MKIYLRLCHLCLDENSGQKWGRKRPPKKNLWGIDPITRVIVGGVIMGGGGGVTQNTLFCLIIFLFFHISQHIEDNIM